MTGLEQIALAALPDALKEGEKELAKGLAALLGRIYDDSLSPGAKQLGGAIEDVVKTVRLLAWPLQMGAALQERFRADLFTAIERVPEDRRTPPPLKLFADVCEGSKFETEDALREMWSQLLSRGCDRERQSLAHPAFAGIIKQLSADEAKFLRAVHSAGPDACLAYDVAIGNVNGRLLVDVELAPEWAGTMEAGPQVHIAAGHLRHLDLLVVNGASSTHSKNWQAHMKFSKQECRMALWGAQFMAAVSEKV